MFCNFMDGTGFIQTFFKGFWRSFQGPHLNFVQEDFIGLKCLLHQLTYIFQHTCLKLIVNYCIEQERFQATTFRVEENSRTFQGKRNSRTFQGLPLKFKDWWSRNFLFCKGESGVPRVFISYSVNIRAELRPSIHFG